MLILRNCNGAKGLPVSTKAFIESITLEQLEDDPYPVYERLRAEAPVAWIPAADVWFITGFQDCSDVGGGKFGFAAAAGHPTIDRVFGTPNVLTAPSPTHEELREGIDPRLKPDSVSALVDDIVRPVARRHLDALSGRVGSDLMTDYFEPVSVEALRRVMGLDGLVDATTLRRWFAGLNRGIANFGLDTESFAIADQISREIEQTIEPLVAELSAHPDDSMISHMLWAGIRDGAPRSAAAIMPSLKVILLGGMQEPGHAAGSTLHGLFSRPQQLALLAADPVAWAPLAVNEGLRWIAPIGAIERQATAEVEVGGVRLPAGAMVEVMIASANRDESHFDTPEVFDLERSTRTHQSFGAGDHFCAGHFFARQVERIMLEELFPALPGLRADEEAEAEISGWFFRAPKVLPVRWDEQPAREQLSLSSSTPSVARHPAPSSPTPIRGTAMLEVVGMRVEADGILGVELRDPEGAELEGWEPGAHIDLWASPGRAGQYSLCGDPSDRSRWRIAVLRERASRGVSQAVHETLRPGTILPVGGPRNNFPLDPAEQYLFVAGGIGITALMPMIRSVEADGLPWELAYCGRSRSAMPFLDELASHGGRVGLFAGDEGRRLDLGTRFAALRGPGASVYCCGPERMLAAAEREAERQGTDLHLERFTGVEALREGDRAFRIIIPSTGESLGVPADRTALDVLLGNGFDIRTSCGEGNCGSCETRVLAGRIEHRDVLLTAAQRERGDRMMVCVSRAVDEEIVLDL